MTELKRVSFAVAKAIKEAGYPQDRTNSHYTNRGELVYYGIAGETGFDAPTYLAVWLWLWREKGIHLNTDTSRKGIVCIYVDETIIHEVKDMMITDPEEAIVAAIEYLVENDLIM